MAINPEYAVGMHILPFGLTNTDILLSVLSRLTLTMKIIKRAIILKQNNQDDFHSSSNAIVKSCEFFVLIGQVIRG